MTDPRLDRVEERIAWLERHVVEQDRAFLELAEDVQRLKRELRALRERGEDREAGSAGDSSPGGERPPHY